MTEAPHFRDDRFHLWKLRVQNTMVNSVTVSTPADVVRAVGLARATLNPQHWCVMLLRAGDEAGLRKDVAFVDALVRGAAGECGDAFKLMHEIATREGAAATAAALAKHPALAGAASSSRR